MCHSVIARCFYLCLISICVISCSSDKSSNDNALNDNAVSIALVVPQAIYEKRTISISATSNHALNNWNWQFPNSDISIKKIAKIILTPLLTTKLHSLLLM